MTRINVQFEHSEIYHYDMRTPAQIEADEAWLNEQFGAYDDEQ